MGNYVERNARPEIFKLKAYVPGKPIEEVERELGITGVIKLASNENPLGPSPMALEKARAALSSLSLYPDGACFNLKRDLAKKFDLSDDRFIIGNGSDELLRLITEVFVGSEEEVIFGDPSFSEYEFMTLVMGGRCVAVNLDDFRYDLAAMKDKINDSTKIVYICNPNNPTGAIVDRKTIELFMDGIPEDILVIFDEAYYEYVDSADFVSGLEYLAKGYNVVVLRTFSKIYGLAGLRVGYGITSPEIAAAVNRVREPFNVNSIAQVAACGALQDDEHLRRSFAVNQEGKKYLYQAFDEMGLKYVPTQANFIFVDTGRECRFVFESLMKQGVIVRTGDIFGYPTYIRITIGTPEENQRFIKELKGVLGK